MAKIADVLTTEQNRQASGEWGKIHLFEMGDFYRAYEWSAWLIVAITAIFHAVNPCEACVR